MKVIFLKTTLTATALLIASAATTWAQKKPEYIFPELPFDEATTARLMEPGSAVIRGKAVLNKKGKANVARKGSAIVLFPVTPYFEAFLELKKQYNGKKKEATMSNAAFTYRAQGKFTDDNGSFEFTDLKPGRYYMLTWIEYEKRKNINIQTGTRYNYTLMTGIGSEPVYTAYTYGYGVETEVSGFAEVQSDGQVVTVNLSNP